MFFDQIRLLMSSSDHRSLPVPAQDRLKRTTQYNPNKVHEKHFAVPISVYPMVHPFVRTTGTLHDLYSNQCDFNEFMILVVLYHNGPVGFY